MKVKLRSSWGGCCCAGGHRCPGGGGWWRVGWVWLLGLGGFRRAAAAADLGVMGFPVAGTGVLEGTDAAIIDKLAGCAIYWAFILEAGARI